MTISVDPNASYSGAGSVAGVGSFTITISTTNANDLIIVDVECGGTSFTTGVSSPTLGTFALHANGNFQIFRYYAVASTPLTGEVITVTQGTGAYTSAIAYAISGANTASPWDAGGPISGQGAAPQDPKSITTVNSNTMVIAGFATNNQNPTAGSGLTTIQGQLFQLAEYEVLSSAQTLSCTIGTGSGTAISFMIDAVKAAATTSPVILFSQACF